MAGSVMD